MYKPLVTVITPSYNHEKYIGECIRSVLSQTYPHWEMIVVDDASCDATVERAKEYATRDNRITIFTHQQNHGIYKLADTYNEALLVAKGDLVAILEADDLWVQDKLEHQVPFFEDPDVVLGYGNRKIIDEAGNILRSTELHKIADKRILNNDPVGMKYYHYLFLKSLTPSETVIVRKAALLEMGGFVGIENCGTIDFPTFFLLAGKGKFAHTEKCLGYYRRHGKNASIGKIEEYKDAYMTLTTRYFDELKHIWQAVRIEPETILLKQEALLRRGREKRATRRHIHRINELLSKGRWREARQEMLSYLRVRRFDSRYPLVLIQCILSFFRGNIFKMRFRNTIH